MKTPNLSIRYALLVAFFCLCRPVVSQELLRPDVDWQPLAAQVRRLIETKEYLGDPFPEDDLARLKQLSNSPQPGAVAAIQSLLDAYCLVDIQINPESRVKVGRGPAPAVLAEQGWRQYLVKVRNDAGVTAKLRVSSPNARPLAGTPSADIENQWLQVQTHDRQPMTSTLSGLGVEYRLLQLYSRDAGAREAKLAFDVGQGTQDLGFRNEVDILFRCEPSSVVTFSILDTEGEPTVGQFVIRDALGRVYPSQAKRLAPDFAFHPQVYRYDGESVRLPLGAYTIQFHRGPESIHETRSVVVDDVAESFEFRVRRWIDPSVMGWWSGDHHIHAAGCAHYTNPTEGVHAPDMIRHCLGEDLKIGANLTWGPCFDYQKQFFTGAIDKVSVYPYLLRYDIEISGFGSHQSGHLCLLNLREQMYPGGTSKDHWPTLCLNSLKWAKRQGALAGPAHSGWGLQVDSDKLPNYIIPPYDGIGANEYVVDVTHMVDGPNGAKVPAVDFLSTVDTPYVWELNMWYHALNAGFRTRISGETDFPCIYGERVGLGRSYVKLDGPLDYGAWCEGIRRGANYVSDGSSHFLEFRVDDRQMGVDGSEVRLDAPGPVKVFAKVAARLNPTPDLGVKNRPYAEKPYWSLERSRLGLSRSVPVEVIVNGYPVAQQEIEADGAIRNLEFDIDLPQSSWVAVRILPSSHTNPVFVLVGDQPIRASRRSVQWLLDGVDQCWSQKERFIRPSEMADAIAAYDHARAVYRKRLAECVVD